MCMDVVCCGFFSKDLASTCLPYVTITEHIKASSLLWGSKSKVFNDNKFINTQQTTSQLLSVFKKPSLNISVCASLFVVGCGEAAREGVIVNEQFMKYFFISFVYLTNS